MRVSRASGVGRWGPTSERVGGRGGDEVPPHLLDWPGSRHLMRRGLSRLIAALAVFAIVPSTAGAAPGDDDVWGAIRVPGGVSAMRRVAGLGDGPRAKTSAVIDLVRVQFGLTIKGSPEARLRFTRYLDYIVSVERLVAQMPDGLVLSDAAQTDRREQDRLKDILAAFGLRRRTSGASVTVELDRDDGAVERHRWLRAAGVDVEDLADELNKQQRVRPALRSDEVPLPAPAFWSTIFRKDHEPLLELVSEPEHLLTYFGLMELDRDTLTWLVANPAVLKRLHDDHAIVFSGFASGIRVRAGAMVVPGGSDAVPVWEYVVDAPAGEPARFLEQLLSRDGGRLAYFYSTAASLDRTRLAFLIGPPSANPEALRERRVYAEAIKQLFAQACPSWDPMLQPLFRPPLDPSFVVALIQVQPPGVVGPDWWPSLFARMAGSDDWPARPKDTLSRIEPRSANAHWLLSFVFENPQRSEDRWQWVRFAQRHVGAAPDTAAHEVEVVLRTFKDMPALALALERMGIKSLPAFAEVAWAARRLDKETTSDDAAGIVRGWQGAFAILEQIHRQRPIDPDLLARLLTSFVRAQPARPMDASGGSAAWTLQELLPALGASVPPADDMEADVFRRVFVDPPAPAVFTWEGVAYRVDMRGPVRDSALAVRAAMPGPRLQQLAELDAAQRRLEAPKTLADVAGAISSLEKVYLVTKSEPLLDRIWALKRIRAEKDVPKAARERRGILKLVDEMAGDVLPALAYAIAVSPSGQAARTFADSARLHTLFSREATGRWQSYAWQPGEITNRSAGGTAIRGSLAGLDLARAQDLLSRASGVVDRPVSSGGSLHELTQWILVDRVALRTPTAWADTAAGVTAAIAQGRARLAVFKRELPPLEVFSDELTKAGVSQSRQNQLRWALERADGAAADVLVSMTDLYRLGSSANLPAGWGQTARVIDGCWCTRSLERAPVERFRGYTIGYVAVMSSDLPLRLAEVLAEMQVPADVLEPMLMFAVQDVLDQTAQFAADDWEPLAWPGRLTPRRVEDYLQAMVSRQILTAPKR